MLEYGHARVHHRLWTVLQCSFHRATSYDLAVSIYFPNIMLYASFETPTSLTSAVSPLEFGWYS